MFGDILILVVHSVDYVNLGHEALVGAFWCGMVCSVAGRKTWVTKFFIVSIWMMWEGMWGTYNHTTSNPHHIKMVKKAQFEHKRHRQ